MSVIHCSDEGYYYERPECPDPYEYEFDDDDYDVDRELSIIRDEDLLPIGDADEEEPF